MDKREAKRKKKEKLNMINMSTERRPMPRRLYSGTNPNMTETGRKKISAGVSYNAAAG